jgi:AraC-like DNA-binding protein
MEQPLEFRHMRRLEGLCNDATAISIGRGCDGIERLEAQFRSRAFSPHRHDSYAIGITLSGVQTFHYRGEARHCLPGQCHILHPDEWHDGAPGNDEGFAYRTVYINPSLIQAALNGQALPFVPDPVIDLTDAQRRAMTVAWHLDAPIDDTSRVEITTVVTELLLANRAAAPARVAPLALSGLLRARSLIAECPARRHGIGELERIADLDRWSIARQFRAAFGTSPTRFRTMRQLDQVRRLISSGAGQADAALAAGFADQSHMSRLIKRAYGLTPGRWATALA